MSDPRNNAGDAYRAFMSMPNSEWPDMIKSLMRGGCLTVMEQQGFERAIADRRCFVSEGGMVKYVKVGGEFRFTPGMSSHTDLVVEGEKVESAGFVHYDTGTSGRFLKLLSEWSEGLRIGPDEHDGEEIAELLGYEYKGFSEY